MYERLEECPSCKHTQLSNYKICKDHSVSGESFALVQCQKCLLVFTNPRPVLSHISRYYESPDYISHTNKATNLTNLAYKFVRTITLRQKVKLINQYTQGKRLLDFGCGTGTFLNYCQTKGYDTEGFEPNPAANQLSTQLIGKRVFTDMGQLTQTDKFHVITAWHVLEHVHDLKTTLKNLEKRLKSNGYLFVAVPNLNSYDANYYGEDWAAYDVPRHLYHFSKQSFSALAKSVKLHILGIHPMKFDAYYVAMLSEKYKTGSPALLKALKTGYLSNAYAAKNNEYSSLIYVLKK